MFNDPSFTPSLVNLSTGAMGDGSEAGDISLRSAVVAANASTDSSKEVLLSAGTYTLSSSANGVLVEPRNDGLLMEGAGSDLSTSSPTIIDANHESRAFDIDDSKATDAVSVEFLGMDIKNGLVTGASGTSDASAAGGAILATATEFAADGLSFDDCDISNNTAQAGVANTGIGGDALGGAVAGDNWVVAVVNSKLTGNTAAGGASSVSPFVGGNAKGGALYVYGTSAFMTTESAGLFGSTVSDNVAEGGTVTVTGSPSDTLTPTGGTGDGGGVYFYTESGFFNPTYNVNFDVHYSEFDSNQAIGGSVTNTTGHAPSTGGDALGGAMDALTADADGDIIAKGWAVFSTFAFNSAVGGNATVTNQASGDTYKGATGGSAFAGGVAVSHLEECTVYDNDVTGGSAADSNGGALYTANGGSAGGAGFGPGEAPGVTDGFLFESLPVTYTIANSTIATDTVTAGSGSTSDGIGFGGGVDDGLPTASGSPLTVDNESNVEVLSTIVAGNYATGSVTIDGPDIVGGFSSGDDGHNLIGYRDGSAPGFPNAIFSGDVVPNAFNDLVGPDGSGDPFNAGLGGLGFNGGQTQTVPLESDSPAIDNGSNAGISGVVGPLSTDQRLLPFERTYNESVTGINEDDHTDVGAYELQPLTVVYADAVWQGLQRGAFISDADPVTAGSQNAYIGSNAFASVNDAVSAVDSGGEVIVNGNGSAGSGTFSEAVVVNKDVELLLQHGNVTFGSLAGNNSSATIDIAGGVFTSGGNNTSTTFDGSITGTGSLTKTGTGTLTLATANT